MKADLGGLKVVNADGQRVDTGTDRTSGDACGGLPGTGALEHVTQIVVLVLEPTCQIGVTGTRTYHR